MRTQLPSILTALSVVSYARTAFGACYFDTGDLVTEPDYLKCVDTPTCCALNRTSSRSKDECLPNGLCENTALSNNNVETVTYWRDWCSNEDWSNGKCLSICIPTDTNQRFKTQQVTPCTGKSDSSKWCCGDTTACCTDDDKSGAVVLAATFGQSISSSTSSPTSTPTTASSSHPASTTAASSTSPSSTPPPASKVVAGRRV
ncbi:hypothetical protein BU24DRAFT_217250 [Aaosphaeria arxii CBS 175.79]|uniref:Uncharacterized protein n=1 Tax=Aaosphaeria arxii CBS 175.79 TaxID=1450172 RepID=A0A6A5XP29_9PLEO|nr:uncharacterized protein BU24DRAFT_217250 [Aaosphaeria arxii CBS 175.79]KAF2014597.1 hypothetical protein BU24DRAFT_217250 [Aaosphaeria arxii CBS 175.79]